MKTKQVLIIRKDLNMRKGKMIAQGAHASMSTFLMTAMRRNPHNNSELSMILTQEMNAWLKGTATKVCVGVDSEEELIELYNKATNVGMVCSLIQDAGLTEFKEPTYTAVAIGPASSKDVDKITGHLKLL